MSNPYADALGKPVRPGKVRKAKPSPSHLRAKKQEREAAKAIRGKLVARSGAGDVKGDVRLQRVARIECKTTKNKSFPLTLELVAKLEREVCDGEVPVILVEFTEGGTRKLGELAIIPSYCLYEFCERPE